MIKVQGSKSFGYSSSAAGRAEFNGLSMPVEFYVWSTTDSYVTVSESVTSATATGYPIQAYQAPIPIGVSEPLGPNVSSGVGGRVFVSALAISGGASGTTYAMPIQR
jgi:hypothetical protein